MARQTVLTEGQCWDYIAKLADFCDLYGWRVEYDNRPGVRNRGLADTYNRTIVLNTSQRVEHIYYVFIHEIGHMIGRLWHRYSWERQYAVLLDKKKRNTAQYKIARVQDEMEAWDIGLKFALDKKCKINKQKYEKLRAECLNGYMLWATKRKTNAKWSKYVETEDSTI